METIVIEHYTYKAYDGTVFDFKEDCINHELSLELQKIKALPCEYHVMDCWANIMSITKDISLIGLKHKNGQNYVQYIKDGTECEDAFSKIEYYDGYTVIQFFEEY